MPQGHIANGFYTQGDVKFQIDLKDGAKTLAAVECLSHDDKIKLASLNELSATPYLRVPLTKVLKSFVQNAWLIANGKTPPLAGHQARVAEYKAALIATSDTADDLLSKIAGRKSTRPAVRYTIDEEKYNSLYSNKATREPLLGQAYLVIKSLLELGAKTGTEGKSTNEMMNVIVDTRETNAPSRNAVNQKLSKILIPAGIVTCVNPQDAKKKPGSVSKDPKPPVKDVPTKKKH